MRTDFVIIFITCASRKEAGSIVDSLLKKRLVACGNIIKNVESKFWWRGKIDNEKEVLVMLKTKKENINKIEKEVRRRHSYEVPEIISIPITAGSKRYLEWLDGAIRDTGASR